MNSSFWLVNQSLLFQKSNIGIIQTQILNLFHKLKLPLLQKSMQTNLKMDMLAESTKFQETFDLIQQIEKKKLNQIELMVLYYLTLKFWRKFLLDITMHISPLQICIWIWKPCNVLLIYYHLPSHYWNKFLLLTFLPK